jgi:ribosome maturation protein SDO1
MSEKYTTARIAVGGEHFEILVHPQGALDYKLGRPVELSQVLVIEEVFADASKGMKASEEKLISAFKTSDVLNIADQIIKRGDLQLTTDQRRHMVEEKRKQIVNFISRNCIDPRSGLPHPPLRIEQAMEQIRIVIDPFKDAEEQAKNVIDDLRPILPLKMEQIRVAVKIPAEYAAKAYGAVKNLGAIKQEEWQADGSLVTVMEIPAGIQLSLMEKLGKITQGNAQVKILK